MVTMEAFQDPHLEEVLETHATGLCDCAQKCVEHPSATAFQFNAGGWCGCLRPHSGHAYEDIFTTPNGATACTLCTIEHMANAAQMAGCDAAVNDGALAVAQNGEHRTQTLWQRNSLML